MSLVCIHGFADQSYLCSFSSSECSNINFQRKLPGPLSVETMEDCLRSVLSISQSSEIDGLCVPASQVHVFVGRGGNFSSQESNSFQHPKGVGHWESYIKHHRRHLNPIHLISCPALTYVRDTFCLVCPSCQPAVISASLNMQSAAEDFFSEVSNNTSSPCTAPDICTALRRQSWQ
jgi:hypothetical protein